MREYKRDIRADIADIIGLNDAVIHEYEPPEKGDRKFRTGHLQYILQYLDEQPPRGEWRYQYHNKLARVVEESQDADIERADTKVQYTGYKKAELEAIRDAVREHEPMGLPSEQSLIDKIMAVYPETTKAEAERAASQTLSHYGRQRGSEDLRVGFTADDVSVRRRVSLKVERGDGN